MNATIFSMLILAILCCRESVADAYLLSSEPIIHENRTSLKEFNTFIFAPIIKTEKKGANKITALMSQELQRIGVVEKKRVFTEQGADLTPLSNPSLQFTLEQLVDQQGKLLPVIKATLSTRSSIEVLKNNEINSLSTNCWSVYLKQNDDVEKTIKTTLPDLLNKFLADYQNVNGKDQKPTFYIIDTTEPETQVKNGTG